MRVYGRGRVSCRRGAVKMMTETIIFEPADAAGVFGLMADYLAEMSAILDVKPPLTMYPDLALYWSEPGQRWAYGLRAGEADVGFALVRRVPELDRFSMAEFFVARAHRRQGRGVAGARAVLLRHPGLWQITQREANAGAIAFWHRVLDGFVAYEEAATVTDVARREQRFAVGQGRNARK